ncbi:MAG: ATP-binding cassette domain-containing protein [Methanocellales archaeon]
MWHVISSNEVLFQVVDLKKYYPITRGLLHKVVGYVKALDGISLNIVKGGILGIVGESGCGKTTLAKTMVLIEKPTAGRILLRGIDISSASEEVVKKFRREVQMIFQDPHSTLDPRMRVRDIIAEARFIHGLKDGEKIEELLHQVGLESESANRFPHELSGGQKQRVAIARALAVNPEILIADEPLSALDISIQAQILRLFLELREKMGLSLIYISHDIGTVQLISEEIAVMYAGRIVESGETEIVFRKPVHPYTQALIDAAKLNLEKIASFTAVSPALTGCRFLPRCPRAIEICRLSEPSLRRINAKQMAACWLYPY